MYNFFIDLVILFAISKTFASSQKYSRNSWLMIIKTLLLSSTKLFSNIDLLTFSSCLSALQIFILCTLFHLRTKDWVRKWLMSSIRKERWWKMRKYSWDFISEIAVYIKVRVIPRPPSWFRKSADSVKSDLVRVKSHQSSQNQDGDPWFYSIL